MTAERLLELMLQDKKVDAGALTLILAADIGAARIVKNAATDDLKEFLKEKIAAARR
jgi:3-dehydroquinate synthetase